MSFAPWRSGLARALHLNRSLAYARYVQLATVRADGRPANRTVVFRGFFEPDFLKFIADHRSQKLPQLVAQPWAEVCWYFPKSREQFRFLGRLKAIQVNDPNPDFAAARQQQWQDLSDAARIQFAWADPGQPRADASAFDPPAPDPAQPLPNFCLLLLDPVEVDHLELRGDPQNRTLYQYDAEQKTWSQEAVNP